MIIAKKLPDRVTFLGGAIAIQSGEWVDTSNMKYQCSGCEGRTDWHQLDWRPVLCPNCCGQQPASNERFKPGHSFTCHREEGVTVCWYCGLKEPAK
jgi:hypothetical protein